MPTGPSSSLSPFLLADQPNVSFTSLITVGDLVGGRTIAGNPDGMGAFDLGNGRMVVTLNHEIGVGQGALHAHGSVGAYVSKLIINKTTLQVENISDLATSVMQDNDGDGIYTVATTAFGAFCSGDMAAQSAFYNPLTNLGTLDRIHLTGEELGNEGRAWAFVVTGADAGKAIELPTMGNLSYENLVANPFTGDTTLVAMQDDQTPGQVYFYVGTKQSTGDTAAHRAGLLNGNLYGVRVTGMLDESNSTAFSTANFALDQIIGAKTMTGGQIQTQSELQGITEFLRPEDGAWDPTHPDWYYFHTTNALGSPSRLWRLQFTDISNPTAGGTIQMVLNGTEGQRMLDNMTIDQYGRVFCQEDPGNTADLARIWMYDPADGSFTVIATVDGARFTGVAGNTYNQNEENSGILDVSHILGNEFRQAFLVTTQAHFTNTGDLVSGGQLQVMYVDRIRNGNNSSEELNGGSENDTFSGAGGADTMRAGSGADSVFGDDGNDSIWGWFGNDTLVGGEGNDSVFGEQDNDVLFGGAGDDSIRGSTGNDFLDGQDGADLLFGGADVDTLLGGNGNDFLDGIDGNDRLYGWRDDDTLLGGTGNDFLDGEDGNDRLFGWIDNDTLLGGLGNDFLDGEDGEDRLFGWHDNDTLLGGAGNDLVDGEDGNDTLFGWTGNDTLYGGNGADDLIGEDGADFIWGWTGNDTLNGGLGNDTLGGEAGNDTFFYLDGFGQDTIIGFEAGAGAGDVVRIVGNIGGFSSFSQVSLAMTAGSGNVVLAIGTIQITFAGIATVGAFSADDFAFT